MEGTKSKKETLHRAPPNLPKTGNFPFQRDDPLLLEEYQGGEGDLPLSVEKKTPEDNLKRSERGNQRASLSTRRKTVYSLTL